MFDCVWNGGSAAPSLPMDVQRQGEGLDAIVTMTINGASIATIAMTRDVHHDHDKRKMAGRWKLSGTYGT